MLERRKVARIAVPRDRTTPDQAQRILDLSLQGARLEHGAPHCEGMVVSVDLPPAPTLMRVPAVVVWTRQVATERTVTGERRAIYQSGVAFCRATPDQETALQRVIDRLASEAAPPRDLKSPLT